jgi:hypothetical protein
MISFTTPEAGEPKARLPIGSRAAIEKGFELASIDPGRMIPKCQ